MKIKKTYLIILLLILGVGVAYFYFFYTPKLQGPINVDFTIDGVMIEDKDNFIKKPKMTESNKVYVQVPYETIEFKPTFSLKENDEDKILWKIKSTYLDTIYSEKVILNTFFEKTGDYTITLIFNHDSISKLLYIISKKKYAKLDHGKNVTSNSEKQVVLNEPNTGNPGVLVKTVDGTQTSSDETLTGTKKTSEGESFSKTSTNEPGLIEVFPEPGKHDTPDKPESLKPVDNDPKELYKIQMAKKDIKELHNNLKSIEQKLKNININSYDIMYIKKYKYLNNKISLLNGETLKIFNYQSNTFKIEYDEIKNKIDMIHNNYLNLNSEFSDFIEEISRINLDEDKDNNVISSRSEIKKDYKETLKNKSTKNSYSIIGPGIKSKCEGDHWISNKNIQYEIKPNIDLEIIRFKVFAKDFGSINIKLYCSNINDRESIKDFTIVPNNNGSEVDLAEFSMTLYKDRTYILTITLNNNTMLANNADCNSISFSNDHLKLRSISGESVLFSLKYKY